MKTILNSTFFCLIFSVVFEDALPQKVPKMLCHYPRKQLRAKRQTQNSNLKTSLEKQPEKAMFQCCSMTEKDEKTELKGIEKDIKKSRTGPEKHVYKQVQR